MKTIDRHFRFLLILLPALFITTQSVQAAVNIFREPPDTTFNAMKDTTAFRNKLSQASKNMKTLEAGFTQQKRMEILTEAVISKGHLSYMNGNMVRWEYTEPFKYAIVINDGKITIRDEKRTSSYDLTANSAFLEINSKLSGIINGDIVNSKSDFRIRYFENDRLYLLKLTPLAKGMKDYFKSIFVWFDKGDLTVAKLRMTELSGDFTEIEFFGKKLNQPIPDDRFILK